MTTTRRKLESDSFKITGKFSPGKFTESGYLTDEGELLPYYNKKRPSMKKKSKPKPEIWWCIETPLERLLLDFSAMTKIEAILKIETRYRDTWALLFRGGYRCVKIEVRKV